MDIKVCGPETSVELHQTRCVVTDDMIRAAVNAHGASRGGCEWEWMRDALIAALSANKG